MLVESSRKAFSFLFQWVNWSTKWEYHLSMGFSICNSSSKCGCSCGFMGHFYREQLNLWVLLRDNFFSPKKSAWRPWMSLAHPLLTRTKRRALQTPTEPFFFSVFDLFILTRITNMLQEPIVFGLSSIHLLFVCTSRVYPADFHTQNRLRESPKGSSNS